MTPPHDKDLSRPVRDFALPVETVLQVDHTIAEALASLRSRKIEQKVIYFYVVDDQQRLIGIIPSRKLLLADPSALIQDVMDTLVISLSDSMTLEEAMEMFAMHRLLAFPVVDSAGRLIGHVDIDLYAEEAVDVSESQRAAEFFQLMGLSLEQARSTPWQGFRMRMPWLMCNMAGGVACAVIAAAFHLVLAKVLLLAMFIPLVLTLSESIAMQSMTLSLQYLRITRAGWRGMWKRAALEWRTIALIGGACGLLVCLAATLWGQGLAVAMVIGLSIAASMIAAATLGVVTPILLHMMRLDPKVAGGPIVLMMGDVATTALYLSLASAWLM